MFENRFLNKIQDSKVKEQLQYKLYKGINIYYSNNMRGIPDASHVENEHHFIINPSQYQLAFTDLKLETIEQTVNKIYSKEDIQELRALWLNDYTEFKEVIKEDSAQQTQYTYEDIKEYFELLFNIEDEMQEYNFKNEDNKQEAIRIILMLSIKGYKVELSIDNRILNNYLGIKIKDNCIIAGEINISLDENYNGYKDIKLINELKKDLLKDDLNITIYGDITNKIDGCIPFNIKLKI